MEQKLNPLDVNVSSEKEAQLNGFNDNIDLNDVIELKKNNKKKTKKKFIITLLIFILVIIFIIGIIGNICFVLLYINQKSEYEFGENEKCKTYDKNHNCVSCNPGYKLEKGECILNYSFIATYQTTSPNQSVRLFGNFQFLYKEMTIDGEKVDFCTTYIFKSAGKHTVIVLLDLSEMFTLNSIFYNSEMTSIIFSEKFNTKKIIYMNNMFKGCSQLTSINLSYFNTKNVENMKYMFLECRSLVSLDLSNFNTQNVEYMNSMFKNCTSLNIFFVIQNILF